MASSMDAIKMGAERGAVASITRKEFPGVLGMRYFGLPMLSRGNLVTQRR